MLNIPLAHRLFQEESRDYGYSGRSKEKNWNTIGLPLWKKCHYPPTRMWFWGPLTANAGAIYSISGKSLI
jgi:hypothetical protein